MMTPQQSATILSRMFGYNGPTDQKSVDQFLAANPAAAARMGKYQETMNKMVGGQPIRGFQEGGDVVGQPVTDPTAEEQLQQLQQGQQQLALQAAQPLQRAEVAQMDVTPGLMDTSAGQVTTPAPAPTVQTATQAPAVAAPTPTPASLMEAATVAPQVEAAVQGLEPARGEIRPESTVNAAQGKVSPQALAEAAQFDPKFLDKVTAGELQVGQDQLVTPAGRNAQAIRTELAQAGAVAEAVAEVGEVRPEELPQPAQIKESEMAQANAITMDGLAPNAVAVAARLDSFNVDNGTLALAAQGDVNALDTVQGQLAKLMRDFDDGTPAWAAGAMRAANATMAARGLGGSSMAGAAIVQAAMESAIPIAAQDAQVFQQMNLQNLNNRQQVALTNAAAQQGLQLQNLNNEQQAALQNSANAFALQSQNLSNMQSVVLANAQIKAALQGQNLSNQQQSNLATAARYAEVANINLNNRQQTALQNNINGVNIELANLSARQQAYVTNANLASALQGQQISNEQQAAIANAARISEVANINFTAEQQAKLHNSNLMQTIGIADLNNRQAAVLQTAATLAQMDLANLSNRQQAAVQNAQNFLQTDLTNLNNEQQTSLFKTQQITQSLFSDQAAENAAAQFNASSENQTNQFFESLSTQVSQFNTSQANAMNQFNAGQENAMGQFQADLEQRRDMFNAQNSLIIEQANAQWRQNVTTLNTAAQNEANMEETKTLNALSSASLAQVWQRERDLMSYAFTAEQSGLDRQLSILLGDKQLEEVRAQIAGKDETFKFAFATDLLFGKTSGNEGGFFDLFD